MDLNEMKSPFEILSKKPSMFTGSDFNNSLGIAQVGYILEMFGLIMAIVSVLTALITLLFVNYPKTVMQTKQKVVHSCFVIAAIGALPYVMDVLLTIISGSLGLHY